MAKARVKYCTRCGCPRKVIIKATVTEQSENNFMTGTFYPLCVPCFLRAIGLEEQAKFANLPASVLECVE